MTNPEINCDRPPARWVQLGFYATSIVFNLCLIAQVLTVGVALNTFAKGIAIRLAKTVFLFG